MTDPYYAACCQIETPGFPKKEQIKDRIQKVSDYTAYAVGQFSEMYPVKLVVFPEAMEGWWQEYHTNKGLLNICMEMPGEETDLLGKIAKKNRCYLAPGSWYEHDPEYGMMFNTFPLFDPKGNMILKYRKVNPWIPLEPSMSPFDIPDYKDEMFPVAKTDIGNLGLYICYDQMFPEVTRQLTANGAEILVKCSAYMDPWTRGEIDWWEWSCRLRSAENLAYGVCCQQGSRLVDLAPFSWGGHSMIIDYEGRQLAEGGRGECIIGSQINIDALRYHRKHVRQHNMIAHLKTGAYTYLNEEFYPRHPEWLKAKDLTPAMISSAVKKVIEKRFK